MREHLGHHEEDTEHHHKKHSPHHHGSGELAVHKESEHHRGHFFLLKPCLLMLLAEGESHGYELIEKLPEVGYLYSMPDPATVYRMLRRLEEDGAVESQWNTSGAGPAKRVYSITPEGEDMLRAWGVTLRKKKQSLEKFLKVLKKKFGE